MKIGITFSNFDLLHAGHIRMLQEAKENCDYLIVGIQSDPTIDRPSKNKPIQSYVERFMQLDECKSVDKIVPYSTESELLEILRLYRPNIRFIGEDYKGLDFTGKDLCLEKGIEIFYNDRSHRLSTSELRSRIINTNTKIQ